MKFRLLPLVVAGLFVGTAGAADPMTPGSTSKPPSRATATFDQLDANKDQVISRDEANKDQTLSRMFKQLDRDNDGQLSAAEYGEHAGTGSGQPSAPGRTN